MLSRDYSGILYDGNKAGMQVSFPQGSVGAPPPAASALPVVKAEHASAHPQKGGAKKPATPQIKGPFGNIMGIGCFMGPGGGQVAICDEAKNEISVYHPDGSFSHRLGGKGFGDGQFLGPRGLAISTEGSMIVADSMNHRVQCFTNLGEKFTAKWQAHKYEILRGSQAGEFYGPAAVAWTSELPAPPPRHSAGGGGGNGNDDELDADADGGGGNDKTNPFENNSKPVVPFESVRRASAVKVIAGRGHPDLVVCDTKNNRIQVVPDDASRPAMTFGNSGKELGRFNEPEGVAYHDNWTEWDAAKKFQPLVDYRASGGVTNVPHWYLGTSWSRARCIADLKEKKAGAFWVVEHSVPGQWLLLHVTPESYNLADIDMKTIKQRDSFFIVDKDVRADGVPKTYTSLQALIVDGEKWLHLKDIRENRHWSKIAVSDTGNDRVQIIGYIRPTYNPYTEKSVLFPHKFCVLDVLGNGGERGSRAGAGSKCHFKNPTQCAYNSHGDLCVVDSGHWRVCIFSPDHELVHTIGSRLELAPTLGRPMCCNFGRDRDGTDALLVGYSGIGGMVYSLPPPAIRGAIGTLPKSAVMHAFSYMDFRAASGAATACKMFEKVFQRLRGNWMLHPLQPKVFMRIKQLFVDWSVAPDGLRIKGHLQTRDPYRSEAERGTDIHWWMANYGKDSQYSAKKQHDLAKQVQLYSWRRTGSKRRGTREKEFGTEGASTSERT